MGRGRQARVPLYFHVILSAADVHEVNVCGVEGPLPAPQNSPPGDSEFLALFLCCHPERSRRTPTFVPAVEERRFSAALIPLAFQRGPEGAALPRQTPILSGAID